MLQRTSLIVSVPAIALGDNIAQLSLGSELRFFEVSAYLRSLAVGPHTLRIRRLKDSSVIVTITFNAAGLKVTAGLSEYMSQDDVLCYDITALGVGASELVVCAWALMPQTQDE